MAFQLVFGPGKNHRPQAQALSSTFPLLLQECVTGSKLGPAPFLPPSRVGQRAGKAPVAKSRGLACSSPPWSVGLKGRGLSVAQAPPAPREKQGEMPMPRAFRVDREVIFRHLFPSFDQARVLAVRPRSWHWPCTPGPLRGPGHCFKMAAYRPRAQVFATKSDKLMPWCGVYS